MEEVSAGLPVALTVSDYTGHTCALWEARFPELRQMALEQCRWFKEEEVGKGESALLNLHVDWGHLVLIIQTAPDFPIKKLAKELADACEMEGRIFSGHTKRL